MQITAAFMLLKIIFSENAQKFLIKYVTNDKKCVIIYSIIADFSASIILKG